MSSAIRSIPFLSSSSFFPDNWNVGGVCCHAGLVLFDGKTGKNLIGSFVALPLLPPTREGDWKKKIASHEMLFSPEAR